MSFLKKNFERLKKEGLKETFEVLEMVFKKHSIDYYLIGARARDLWTDHIALGEKRTTEDVDFCIYINEHAQYITLVKDLVENYGFTRDEVESYRFYFNGTIDLIPFGGIEKDGEVLLENPPTELSVYGTKEAVAYAEIVEGAFKVVTLPGLCVLKLIAFYEKPDRRGKDLEDFYFLLENYGEIAGDQLFEGVEHEDLIKDDFELILASARLLGRQIKNITSSNPELSTKLNQILVDRLKGFSEKEIDSMYQVRDNNDKLVERFKLVTEVIKGMND
jgi:predicted nucleotidyltransferase